MAAKKGSIVTGYARMWPREVFGRGALEKQEKEELRFLDSAGVYILYRDDRPHYIGQAKKLYSRLWSHAIQAGGRYYHFWNCFSAFAVADQKHRDELEGILIAAMPTANSAKPKLKREKMGRAVRTLLRKINPYRVR
jgi:predicted GIY-YIG superfamily endonuclease